MKLSDLSSLSLYQSCLLGSIAHAIMVTRFPELDYEQAWDGQNFTINDGQSTRFTVSFDGDSCIGAGRDESVGHSFFSKDVMKLIADASPDLKKLATMEAFQYLLDEKDGRQDVSITCAFWGYPDGLYAMMSNEDFLKNGGRILSPFFQEYQKSINYWKKYYSMESVQEKALEQIFKLRIAERNKTVPLKRNDFSIFNGIDEDGFKASIESFGELRIVVL